MWFHHRTLLKHLTLKCGGNDILWKCSQLSEEKKNIWLNSLLKHVHCWTVLVAKLVWLWKDNWLSKRYCIIHRLVLDVDFSTFSIILLLPEYSRSWKVGFKKKTWYSHGFDWGILKGSVCARACHNATSLHCDQNHKGEEEKKASHHWSLPKWEHKRVAFLCWDSPETQSPHMPYSTHYKTHAHTLTYSKHSSNTTIQNLFKKHFYLAKMH